MTANAVVGWLVKTTWVMMAIPCKVPDSIKHGRGDIRRMNRPQVVIKVCSEDTNFPQPACACLTLHLLKSASDEQLATTKQPIDHRWSVVSNQLPGFRHNHRSQYAQKELALVRWSRSRWTKGLEPCWVPTFVPNIEIESHTCIVPGCHTKASSCCSSCPIWSCNEQCLVL